MSGFIVNRIRLFPSATPPSHPSIAEIETFTKTHALITATLNSTESFNFSFTKKLILGLSGFVQKNFDCEFSQNLIKAISSLTYKPSTASKDCLIDVNSDSAINGFTLVTHQQKPASFSTGTPPVRHNAPVKINPTTVEIHQCVNQALPIDGQSKPLFVQIQPDLDSIPLVRRDASMASSVVSQSAAPDIRQFEALLRKTSLATNQTQSHVNSRECWVSQFWFGG